MAREEDWEDEEEEITCESEKNRILKRMHSLDLTTQEGRDEYRELSELMTDMTESDRNEKQAIQLIAQKYSWIIPTVIQSATSALTTALMTRASRKNVKDVLKYEDEGNIVKTAATGFINKPR